LKHLTPDLIISKLNLSVIFFNLIIMLLSFIGVNTNENLKQTDNFFTYNIAIKKGVSIKSKQNRSMQIIK